jgi:hypothetical protein
VIALIALAGSVFSTIVTVFGPPRFKRGTTRGSYSASISGVM